MIYRPLYVDKIMAFVDTPFVKILTGIRRCGKSTILKIMEKLWTERGVRKEKIVSYRFDSIWIMCFFKSIPACEDVADRL